MALYIYGKNVIESKLNHSEDILTLYVEENKHPDILKLAKRKRVKVEVKSKAFLNKIEKANHQGLIAKIKDYQYYQLEDIISNKKYPLILMLDQIEDPHNFGAIIRSAEAVGVDGIIILNKRSVSVNATVIKTAAGSIDNVKIVSVSNLNNTIRKLKELGYFIVGSALEDSVDYQSVDYKMKTVLVVGSEGKGISHLVKKNCDFIVKIPMVGKINSLNVSVASAVLMYEIFNQQNR